MMNQQKARQYRSLGMLLACLPLMLVGMVGCVTPPKATASPEDTLLGRRRYDTGHTYVYASSQKAADEVSRDLAEATRDYQKATGHVPISKGLIVVTDRSDAPYADRMTVIRMGQHMEDMQRFRNSETPPADLQEKLAKAEKEVGPEAIDNLFLSKPGTTDVREAVSLWTLTNRPAAGANWVLTVPTADMAQYAFHEMIQKAMAKKEVSVAGKILVAPLLGLIEVKAREAAHVDRLVGMYLMLACSDPALDAQARQTVFQKYQKRKEQDVMQGMPGADNPAAATQAAASSPATRSTP